MANVLAKAKQIAVIRALVDGVGVRATERITDTSRETVLSLLVRVGEGCAILHDRLVRNVNASRIECDELWGFVAKKQRHITDADPEAYGDQWTWTALDPDSTLVVSYLVGKRNGTACNAFVADLAARLAADQCTGLPKRVQISTDGLGAYVDAIERAFVAANVIDHPWEVEELVDAALAAREAA